MPSFWGPRLCPFFLMCYTFLSFPLTGSFFGGRPIFFFFISRRFNCFSHSVFCYLFPSPGGWSSPRGFQSFPDPKFQDYRPIPFSRLQAKTLSFTHFFSTFSEHPFLIGSERRLNRWNVQYYRRTFFFLPSFGLFHHGPCSHAFPSIPPSDSFPFFSCPRVRFPSPVWVPLSLSYE